MSAKNPTSSQKSFAEQQRELGGIAPSQLKEGEIAVIVTSKACYTIQTVDNGKHKWYNVTCDNPSDLWHEANPDKGVVRILSHHSGLKFDMMDWIGKGMRPVFKFLGGASLMVGSIRAATIMGKDYDYELWQD
jgi:hypothetical protein